MKKELFFEEILDADKNYIGKNVIIEKVEGCTKRYPINLLNNEYFTEGENPPYKKLIVEEDLNILFIKHSLLQVMQFLEKYDNGSLLKETVTNLERTKNYDELDMIIYKTLQISRKILLVNFRNENYLKHVNRLLRWDNDVMRSLFTKELLKTYVNMIYNNIPKDIKYNIVRTTNNKNINHIAESINNIYHHKYFKENIFSDIEIKLLADIINFDRNSVNGKDNYSKKNCHKCLVCPVKIGHCPKVNDVCKKDIEEYPFIKNGFQITNSEGLSETLIVNDCQLYKKLLKK